MRRDRISAASPRIFSSFSVSVRFLGLLGEDRCQVRRCWRADRLDVGLKLDLRFDLSVRTLVHADELDWIKSPAAGVERRMLFRIGEEKARATSIVRYAPERGELLRHAAELLVRLSVEKIVDHLARRSEMPAGQGATSRGKLLLIDHGMRVVALTGFVGIAGVKGALILARRAIEERSQCGGDDPSEVENAGARIFERGGHTAHFVRILCTQGWVKRP